MHVSIVLNDHLKLEESISATIDSAEVSPSFYSFTLTRIAMMILHRFKNEKIMNLIDSLRYVIT